MKLPKGLKTSVVILILMLAFGYSIVLVANVSRQMDELSEAHGGDGIWSLSQLEVEYRKLNTALARAKAPADLALIRERFDIFFSRVRVLQEGDISRLHGDDPAYMTNLKQVARFIEAAAPYIDGDDAMLLQSLPMLIASADSIDAFVRDLALSGGTVATADGDELRESSRTVLTQLIATTLFLIVGMAILIFVLRRLYRQAQEGENAKGKLLAVMSHEIRTPLNGILGAADLLQSTELTEAQRRYVAAMKTSGDVLMGHVNDVLEMSRLNAEERRKAIRPMTLPQVVSDLVHSQSMAAAKNGNSLDVRVLKGVPERVLGDSQGLQQILLNLLGNALKFTRDGHVLLEVDSIGDSDQIEFRVSDTGPGISSAELPHVFDDFFTGDVSNARLQPGVGLGLGITKRIVDAMDGEIGVDSILGEGSLFWVRLTMPSVRQTATKHTLPEDTQSSEQPQVRLNVLLVEDNPINRMITCDMLRNAGHKVTAAEDGMSGLEQAITTRFDLILMDISMPGMDGFATAKAIRTSCGASADSPIVALTAQTMPPEADEISEAGIQGVFHKPMTTDALHRAVLAKAAHPSAATNPDPHSDGPLLRENIIADVLDNIGLNAARTHYEELREDMAPLLAQFKDPSQHDKIDLNQVHKLAGAAAIMGLCRLHHALAAFERDAPLSDGPAKQSMAQELIAIWDSSHSAISQVFQERE